MKTQLIFIILLLTTGLQGQRGIEAGATILPQIYGLYYDQSPSDRAIKIPYSFAIGVDAGFNFNDYIGLRTGFLYSPLGEKYNDIAVDPEVSYELNLSYIQLPVYLKLNSSIERSFSFIMIAGPYFSLLNEATLTVNSEDPVPVLGDYNRFLTGGALGLGLQLNLSRGGNLNFLWYNSASLDPISTQAPSRRVVSTGLQLAYHYFIWEPR
ncbi:outer membrane beta-barrel protein [Portibacter marinus]|uniref:outer membrane beta-barrel protein n=1 Tax=Portibacter marinus TaxID=2898660 RepID=UPI001F223C67|nr:outer membrane beta-barrel protein [Portibacter marinus]